MTAYDFDLFTIGGGSGGVRASRISAALGARVGVAESTHWGGTCVNIGCVPKKLMVFASELLEDMEDAEGYGVHLGHAPRFDWKTLIANKNAEIARLNGIYVNLLKKAGVKIYSGRAHLLDAHTVAIVHPDGEMTRVTAERILIATGGKPVRPSEPGAELGVVSDDVFYLEDLPKRVMVAGGGYIAVEFAGIFNGMGAETHHIYRRDVPLRGFDDDMRATVVREMAKKGVKQIFGTIIDRIERANGALRCSLSNGDTVEVDLVLYAIGRTPAVEGLGLEAAGVKLNERGAIVVNDELQTSVPNIYALGDVTDRINLTPVATAEGMALAHTLFGDGTHRVDYEGVPSAVFSQPPMATVGLTEAEARARYDAIDVYFSDFRPMKRILPNRDEHCAIKLIVDQATDRVIGAHMVGMESGEIIQGVAVAMKAGATKAQFDQTIGIHPTIAEEFVTLREKRPEPPAV